MQRTKLADRTLPDYTKGEEIFNMVSHIVGGGFGVIALVACVITSALYGDAWGIVSSCIYGVSLIALYTMSSVYHGLRPSTAKKVLQIIDHCTIYFLIGGSYTPVTLCAIRIVSPTVGWLLFGVVWGIAALAITFTAIDLKKYTVFSMICYIGMGWCIVFAANYFLQAVAMPGVMLLLVGGIAYTIGAILYGMGKKHRYMHSIFHLFVLVGSILQFLSIWLYVI
ncbi:MAG: hemolysin III family protein [Clostridia bacterium]|nr:hemolysin III family protein [Clostridia bacterium]